MKKVAIVTDSIACLTRELVEQYNIGILPVNFFYNGEVYKDGIDITPSQAYELFLKDPESFKTSSISPGDCLQILRETSQLAKNILCITISSKLSTVYNVVLGTIEQIKTEFPAVSICVLDSMTATAAEGLVALEAARASESGKSMEEVVKTAEDIKGRVKCFVLLDTIQYVYRSGRIPKIAAQAASRLNIRPILAVSNGIVRFIGATRSRADGIERVFRMVRGEVGQSRIHVAVMHAYAQDEAEKFKERISSEFDCAEIWLSEFSPVMGYACGTGTLGIAFYPE